LQGNRDTQERSLMQDPAAAEQFQDEILELPGRTTLEISVVRGLSRRSDVHGTCRYLGHLTAMACTGLLIWLSFDSWLLLFPAMILHGFTIVTMFAPMHECVHKTAFKTPWLNDTCGWLAGALCFYNFTYYRRYHTWHHRYTQDDELDPELETPKPGNRFEYWLHLSGLPFWWHKLPDLVAMAAGKTYPFVPPQSRNVVAWSARAQVGLYLALAVGSVLLSSTVVWWYWLLPAILAQPLLRAILIVEHTGCSTDTNGLTNTRTTLASLPVRFLMWNMPFHAEHHLYPSITFFSLPLAHRELNDRLAHIAASYPAANGEVLRSLHVAPLEDSVGAGK
jgi:fatty acid desaturase